MFSKTKATNIPTANNVKKVSPSVISAELHILGNLITEGMVDIDGSVEGNVKADQVTIRSNGRIAGDIIAATVHIYGEVRGLVRAHSVNLYSSCRIEGVIIHQSLSVEDGAFIDAKFKRLQDKSLLSKELNDFAEDEDSEGMGTGSLPGNLRLIG